MVGKQDKTPQLNIFDTPLERFINLNHELCILSKKIDWDIIEEDFSFYYSDIGRPSVPIRRMIGLLLLKQIYNLSDESIVDRWIENPYWQYFTGEERFQYKFPIHPTSMTKWRNRIKEEDLLKLLEETVKSGFKSGFLKVRDVKRVNVDTTVQEKNISYPRDIKLYYKLMEYLVRYAKAKGLKLKQTYMRAGKKLLREYHHELRERGYRWSDGKKT